MNTWIKVGLSGTIFFLVAAIGVYTLSNTSRPDPARVNALKILQTPPSYEGPDGFPALYTLGYEVPENKWKTVVDEDVRRFNVAKAKAVKNGAVDIHWTSHLDDYDRLPASEPNSLAACNSESGDCLEMVRANKATYANFVHTNQVALDQASSLVKYDHFRDAFPVRAPQFLKPIPQYQHIGRLPIRNALLFIEGDTTTALMGACSDILLGQKMVSSSDSLIVSMVGASLIKRSATLVTDMLSEIPPTAPLPNICSKAFSVQPRTQQPVCRAMMGEGRMILSAFLDSTAHNQAKKDSPWMARTFNPRRTALRMAPDYTQYCQEEVGMQIKTDVPVSHSIPERSLWEIECVANATGCILDNVAQPEYWNYARRLQDADAIWRATAGLVELRNTGKPIDAKSIADLPKDISSSSRPIQLDEHNHSIELELYFHPQNDAEGVWKAPLPGSRN